MMPFINAICDPVFVLDMDGRHVEVNDEACRLLGYTRVELLNMTSLDLDTPEFAPLFPQRRQLIKQQGRLSFESAKVCKDGRVLHLEINARRAKLEGLDLIVTTARDITHRKRAQNQLAYQKKYFEALFRSSSDAIVSLDQDHRVVDINPRFEELFGYTLEELAGHNIDDFIHPEGDKEECRIATSDVLKGLTITLETVRRHKNGTHINVLVRGTPIIMENKIIGVLGIYTDITDRFTAGKKLEQAHKLQQDIIDFLPDPTFVVDNQGVVIAWNRAMENMSGVKKEDIIGCGNYAYAVPFYGHRRPVLLDYFLTCDPDIVANYRQFKDNQDKIFAETFAPLIYRGRGAYLWVTASPLYDRENNLTGAIESIRDITEQKEREERLEFLSWHDQLTGMYNRTFFEHKIKHIDPVENLPLTIITCDVDGLKLINDTLGHTAGDALLKSAAAVLKASIRSTDYAARIGGDEFAILLTRTGQSTGARVCQRIKAAIDKHNLSNPVPLSISIGMSTAVSASTDVTELFKEADNNMYREKLLRGKSARHTVVQALMSALEARDFVSEGHCSRLADLATGLAKLINLPADRHSGLQLLARFHDIGKVGVPDHILFKPGALTAEERSLMRMHCEIGHRIAMAAPDLAPIAHLILKHHEWWNGQGYPLGLQGDEIPLECRILAIIDAYDAMTSDRPYRKAMARESALDELLRRAGTQFDPHLVTRFLYLLKNSMHH